MIWRILFPVYFMFLNIEEETQNDVIVNAHKLFLEHALENMDSYNNKIMNKIK